VDAAAFFPDGFLKSDLISGLGAVQPELTLTAKIIRTLKTAEYLSNPGLVAGN
jgi:hypothetical protein